MEEDRKKVLNLADKVTRLLKKEILWSCMRLQPFKAIRMYKAWKASRVLEKSLKEKMCNQTKNTK